MVFQVRVNKLIDKPLPGDRKVFFGLVKACLFVKSDFFPHNIHRGGNPLQNKCNVIKLSIGNFQYLADILTNQQRTSAFLTLTVLPEMSIFSSLM